MVIVRIAGCYSLLQELTKNMISSGFEICMTSRHKTFMLKLDQKKIFETLKLLIYNKQIDKNNNR